MVLLQMSGQTWQRKNLADPAKMPYARLPVLQMGEDLIPDSEFIEDWLTRQGANFYPGLGAKEIAVGQAIIRMVEESLRLALVHDRWLDQGCWNHLWPIFFATVPWFLRRVVSGKVRKSVKAGLMSNGIARLSPQDRLRKAGKDLDVLRQIIGTNSFMLGKVATAVDAAVLPVLSMIDRLPVETDLTRLLRSHECVAGYLRNGRATLYSGLPG